ncbi:MAG: hypothetical protein QOJ34_2959 [Pseudonocardiales bacterium]|nr:hypothetical protein [Pseudonocardiales bacterium]
MNPDIDNARPGVLSALRKADSIVGICDVRAWPRPQSYVTSLAMLNACREAARAVPAFPPPPTKPSAVAKWIDSAVEIRAREAARHDVIDELVLTWERETAAAGLAAVPDTAARLVGCFDELLEAFDSVADAPRQLTGRESPEDSESHSAALRAASDLTIALTQRAQIADAAGESEDVGGEPVWLVLAPTPATTRDQVQDAIATFRERFPASLAEWDSLRPLGLRLARVGEVGARRQRHSDLMWRIAHETPDLGQRDHSYGEIEGNPAGPAYGLQLQAEADHMFANSPSLNV